MWCVYYTCLENNKHSWCTFLTFFITVFKLMCFGEEFLGKERAGQAGMETCSFYTFLAVPTNSAAWSIDLALVLRRKHRVEKQRNWAPGGLLHGNLQEFTLGNMGQKSAPQFSIRSRSFLHMPLCLEPYGEEVCGGPSFQRIRKSGRAKSERFPVTHICLPAVWPGPYPPQGLWALVFSTGKRG